MAQNSNPTRDSCPSCRAEGVAVLDSRPVESGRRRRRCCRSCGHKWTTFEVPSDAFLRIISAARAVQEGLRSLALADDALRGLKSTLDAMTADAEEI